LLLTGNLGMDAKKVAPAVFRCPAGCGGHVRGFVRLVFGALGAPTEFGLPRLEEGTTVVAAILLEAAGTFVRCSSSLYSSFHLEKKPKAHAAIVGIALFIPTLLVGPFTGAAFNPAMSLGPAVASMDFGNQYVYPLGAALGCAVAIAAFGTRRWKGHG